uniref:Uncharacterized protein n=1 Tax=Ascaris lumbricoides TaxID=6252 RepID=A0A0M3HY31_ASCLU
MVASTELTQVQVHLRSWGDLNSCRRIPSPGLSPTPRDRDTTSLAGFVKAAIKVKCAQQKRCVGISRALKFYFCQNTLLSRLTP